jgi:hypothetical protein
MIAMEMRSRYAQNTMVVRMDYSPLHSAEINDEIITEEEMRPMVINSGKGSLTWALPFG